MSKDSRWDVWSWNLWWLVFLVGTAIMGVAYFAHDKLWALFGLIPALLLGLVAFSLWTLWLARRRRRQALCLLAESHALDYQGSQWSFTFTKEFAQLPLLHKGSPAWRLQHVLSGVTRGLAVRVVDYSYTSSAIPTPSGLIEGGRNQTVLIWTNVPAGRQDFVLEARAGLVQGLGSMLIGDTVDPGAFGLVPFTGAFLEPPSLDAAYRVWAHDPATVEQCLPPRARERLLAEPKPWTIECVGGVLAIYRPSFAWPTGNFATHFEEVIDIIEAFGFK